VVQVKAGEKLNVRPDWTAEAKAVASAKKPATPGGDLSSEVKVPPPDMPKTPEPAPSKNNPPPPKVDPTPPTDAPKPAERPKPTESPEPTESPKPPEPAKATVLAKPKEPPPATTPPPEEKKPKSALPNEAAQQEIVKQLSDAYDFAAARSAGEKLRLARTMLDLSAKAQDNPAERFVLLRKAMELAGDGGDASLALRAVDGVGADFSVDVLEVKRKVLNEFAAGTTDASRIESLSAAVAATIAQAEAEDRFDVATDLANTLYRVCSNPTGQAKRKFAFDQRAEVQRRADQWKQFEEALATLKATPDDAGANLKAGRWFCVNKAHWDRALPHLAKSSDERLQRVAQQELASPPQDAVEQVKLGDGWWDAAQQTDDAPLKKVLLRRAGTWYDKARPGLNSPVMQQKVDNRLKQIGEA
jgi:hypothetical protein